MQKVIPLLSVVGSHDLIEIGHSLFSFLNKVWSSHMITSHDKLHQHTGTQPFVFAHVILAEEH